MTGVQRAAVLLLSLGEADAAEVLKHMGAKEVQKLGLAMATMSGVTREQVMQVMEDFERALARQTSLGVGADDYIRNVLIQALGAEKAGSLIDRILLGRNTTGLDTLKWMDPRAVADLVRNEHPQICAIVLSHLDPDQAAEALKFLPERVRADVLLRIATLDGIPPHALNELNEIMERQFAGNQNLKSSNIGGVQCAANILNFMDGGQDQTILTEIARIDAPLGSRIQDLMFVFDDLVELDDRELQTLLREVSGERLGIAPELMLRKKTLESLLKSGFPAGPYRLPDSLRGWRRELMGQALLDTLAGQTPGEQA
nr:flagellar motor switch protein FliG [Gammaproteobacteria bacterium]